MPINTPGIVPIFEDRLSHVQLMADIKAWYNTSIPKSDYFLDSTYNYGRIAKIGGGYEYMLTANGPELAVDFVPRTTIENNTQDFYTKQDMLFYSEAAMMNDWLYAIQHKEHTPVATPQTFSSQFTPAETITSYGPYIDLSLQSEANKIYGLSESKKSAWLQRSLTRGIMVDVRSRLSPAPYEMKWVASGSVCYTSGSSSVPDPDSVPNTYPVFDSWEDLTTNGVARVGAFVLGYEPTAIWGDADSYISQGADGGVSGPCLGGNDRRVIFGFTSTPGYFYISYYPAIVPYRTEDVQIINSAFYNLGRTEPVYIREAGYQSFPVPEIRYVYYPTCL